MSTVEETAERLGTSTRYVRRLIEQGRLAIVPTRDATLSLDPNSIHFFELGRQSPGRPRKLSTRDALARELRGTKSDDISPRTLARIRHDLSHFTLSELAENLRYCSDSELSGLAAQALTAPTYLEQKRAQKALRELHSTWVVSGLPRGRRDRQLPLTDSATTSSTATAARQALRENNHDLAFRLLVDHIASLARQRPEAISALMTQPKPIGDAQLDALLHGGIAWLASHHNVDPPSWHRPLRLATLWNPTGRGMLLDKALPQFLEANIYVEARDVGAA